MGWTMEFFIPVGLIYHLSLSTASAAPGCCQHNSTLILHNGFQCEFTILNVFRGDRGKQIIAYNYHSNIRSVKKWKGRQARSVSCDKENVIFHTLALMKVIDYICRRLLRKQQQQTTKTKQNRTQKQQTNLQQQTTKEKNKQEEEMFKRSIFATPGFFTIISITSSAIMNI